MGGRREGAGRKPGSATQKTREIADRALREGISPLEIMLRIMREQFYAYRRFGTPESARVAVEAAEVAAPFVHPRLSAVGRAVDIDLSGTPAEQARQVARALSERRITPEEARDLAAPIAAQVQALNADLRERLDRLEQLIAPTAKRKGKMPDANLAATNRNA